MYFVPVNVKRDPTWAPDMFLFHILDCSVQSPIAFDVIKADLGLEKEVFRLDFMCSRLISDQRGRPLPLKFTQIYVPITHVDDCYEIN